MTSQGSGNVPVILNLIKDRPGAMAGSFYLSNLRAMKGNNKEGKVIAVLNNCQKFYSVKSDAVLE